MNDRDVLLASVDLRLLADELLGGRSGSDRSPTWRCPSPTHAQTGRTPPVSVFTTRRGDQRWRCHGCGIGGTAIDLLCATTRLDIGGAFENLRERAGRPDQPFAPQPPVPQTPADLAALARYVDECARRFWLPEGDEVRAWLTLTRRLPEAVLRHNHIGADLGPRRQPRPEGLPRARGAVLPAIERGEVTYAQIRVLYPHPGRPRYLNPSSTLAPNPRLARFRPSTLTHEEVVITEGALDALSATAAGYRAVAVLGTANSDASVARSIAHLPHPLVIAFDADDAGRDATQRLARHLREADRDAASIDLGEGDLNDALGQASDWSTHLPALIRDTPRARRQSRSLSR